MFGAKENCSVKLDKRQHRQLELNSAYEAAEHAEQIRAK